MQTITTHKRPTYREQAEALWQEAIDEGFTTLSFEAWFALQKIATEDELLEEWWTLKREGSTELQYSDWREDFLWRNGQ